MDYYDPRNKLFERSDWRRKGIRSLSHRLPERDGAAAWGREAAAPGHFIVRCASVSKTGVMVIVSEDLDLVMPGALDEALMAGAFDRGAVARRDAARNSVPVRRIGKRSMRGRVSQARALGGRAISSSRRGGRRAQGSRALLASLTSPRSHR